MADHIEDNKINSEKISEEKNKIHHDETKKERVTVDNEEIAVEKNIQNVVENSGSYNFLTNLSNQANLTNTYNTSPFQANAVFVVVSPYYIEKFNLEGLDLNINIDQKGTVFINNEAFNTLEIKPGIRVFGISKDK